MNGLPGRGHGADDAGGRVAERVVDHARGVHEPGVTAGPDLEQRELLGADQVRHDLPHRRHHASRIGRAVQAVDRHQEIGEFSDVLFGAEEALGRTLVLAQGRLQRIRCLRSSRPPCGDRHLSYSPSRLRTFDSSSMPLMGLVT